MNERKVDVLVVGAGPAGLTCARELARAGAGEILVLDREKKAGGVPRLCGHLGFGIRDFHRVYSGPAYAETLLKKALDAGARVLAESTVTEWTGEREVLVTSPRGIESVSARAVLLATGCRERPRPARLIPGYRPRGIFNTGSLQDFVHGYGRKVGTRAVIAGAELVSYSAIHTLEKGGCRVLLMTTPFERDQVYFPYTPYKWWSARLHLGIPLVTNTRISDISGKDRLSSVELENVKTGEKRKVECDTLVLTGDWIPDHEFSRLGGLEIDEGTLGPAVDGRLRTSREGVFAAGNLLRGAEPGDAAALEGRHAAASIASYLDKGGWPGERVKVLARDPVRWVFPNFLEPGSDVLPRGRFLFRVNEFVRGGRLSIRQGEKLLFAKNFSFLGPNDSWSFEGSWARSVGGGEPVTVTLESRESV